MTRSRRANINERFFWDQPDFKSILLSNQQHDGQCELRALSFNIKGPTGILQHSAPSNDAALSSIDSSTSQVQQTRLTSVTPHVGDYLSVTINDLPIEILGYIFMLAKAPCILDALSDRVVATIRLGDEPPPPPLPAFSPDNIPFVCAYWRKLSSDTPALWTHIDLSIDRLQDANLAFHAQRSLERAKQLPLHIHVEGSRKLNKPQAIIALLAPYTNRIASLELFGNARTSRSILRGLFNAPYHGTVQHLCLHDEDYSGPQESQGGLFTSKLLEGFLLSIPSLILHGPSLNYNSPAFRGLTNLAIIFSDMHPTPYRLTQILGACPELQSLTLLELTLAPGNPPANAAKLSSLQTLDLRYMGFSDIITITSCILPRQGLSMSLTLNMQPEGSDDSDDEDDNTNIHDLSALSIFFKQFHITRLFLNADYITGGIDPDTALRSVKNSLTSLEELALDGDLLEDGEVEGRLLTERFPRLHTLHIIGKNVPVGRLKVMLASSPIQMVRFRWQERHPSEVLQPISEVVPSVSYCLYDTLNDCVSFPWDMPATYYDKNIVS